MDIDCAGALLDKLLWQGQQNKEDTSVKSPVLRLLRRVVAPIGLAVAVLCSLPAFAAAEPLATLQAAPNRPFPQHVAYTRGSIKPNAVPQVGLDAATKSFYLAWRTKYLRAGCGPGRYYIYVAEGAVAGDPNIDPNTLTVSEAHGYGMMIFAWMAGYDPNAKAYFDGMVAYWKYFQLPAHPGLMAWKQQKGCVNAPQRAATAAGVIGAAATISAAVGASDSASDGDLDIAYALLLADKQWGSAGTFNYKAEALKVIRAIYAYEINPVTRHIALGDWANPSVPQTYYATRPSDFMFDHLHAFKAATGDARWDTVITAAYQLVHRMQTLYSPATGLLPDFIININTAPQPPAGFLLESVDDGSFS